MCTRLLTLCTLQVLCCTSTFTLRLESRIYNCGLVCIVSLLSLCICLCVCYGFSFPANMSFAHHGCVYWVKLFAVLIVWKKCQHKIILWYSTLFYCQQKRTKSWHFLCQKALLFSKSILKAHPWVNTVVLCDMIFLCYGHTL